MRAALSLSLSSVVGQNASAPTLLDNLFTGAPSLSTHPYTLSKPALPPVLAFAHIFQLPQWCGACGDWSNFGSGGRRGVLSIENLFGKK
jgi:hypothetical protein